MDKPNNIMEINHVCWYIQQILTHGRAEDIRTLKLDQIAAVLDEITLPEDVRSLWQRFLETPRAQG